MVFATWGPKGQSPSILDRNFLSLSQVGSFLRINFQAKWSKERNLIFRLYLSSLLLVNKALVVICLSSCFNWKNTICGKSRGYLIFSISNQDKTALILFIISLGKILSRALKLHCFKVVIILPTWLMRLIRLGTISSIKRSLPFDCQTKSNICSFPKSHILFNEISMIQNIFPCFRAFLV